MAEGDARLPLPPTWRRQQFDRASRYAEAAPRWYVLDVDRVGREEPTSRSGSCVSSAGRTRSPRGKTTSRVRAAGDAPKNRDKPASVFDRASSFRTCPNNLIAHAARKTLVAAADAYVRGAIGRRRATKSTRAARAAAGARPRQVRADHCIAHRLALALGRLARARRAAAEARGGLERRQPCACPRDAPALRRAPRRVDFSAAVTSAGRARSSYRAQRADKQPRRRADRRARGHARTCRVRRR